VDSSWTANHFAHTGLSLAGSTLLADGSARQNHSGVGGLSRRRPNGSRPNLYPQDLLTSPRCDLSSTQRDGIPESSVSGNWWLAHTLPRQEKSLADALYAREVPFYLPLVTRKSLSRGRTRVAHIALFPGYLFVCGGEEDRLSVLKTNRVLTVRRAPDDARLRADLRRFSELIALGAPLLPEARLIPGERVRVKTGLFRDQEGVIIRRNGKTRLLIAVDYLQQGASLEIDDCLLECV
jgi:transcription antitermination factor NusG